MKLSLGPDGQLLVAKLFLVVVVPVLLVVAAWALVKMWGRLSSAVKEGEPDSKERHRHQQLAEEAKIVVVSSVTRPSYQGEGAKLLVRVRNDSGGMAEDVRIWAYCRIGAKVVFAGVSPGEDLAPGIETLREIPLSPDVKRDEIKLKVSLGQDPRKWGPWT